MAVPTAMSTADAISSLRSPVAAPIRAPSSSPARDITTLTTPNTTAASASPVWYAPRTKPTARLSLLNASPLSRTRPVRHDRAGRLEASVSRLRQACARPNTPTAISTPAPSQRAAWPRSAARLWPTTSPTTGMPASNTPNTTATRTLTLRLTPLTPIPIEAAKLDRPTATASSSRANMVPTLPALPQGRRTRAFEAKQQFLAFEAAAVPGQAAVGADHPVAGDDDRDRVGAVGQAHRP